MKELEKNIFGYLSKKLSPKRFEHSYNVSQFAVELASLHGEDILKAQTAGLLHDCAKNLSDKKLIKACAKEKPEIKYFDEIKENAPHLLHSYVSAYIAGSHFGVKDKDVLAAIRSHTLGRPGMCRLEKIIFVADSLSSDRKHKHASKTRKLARKNFEEAFLCVLSNKIKYVLDNGIWLCKQTSDTWNYYAKKD
jgi:predicted HD superfamily hydrolase involved in NAD metabolism